MVAILLMIVYIIIIGLLHLQLLFTFKALRMISVEVTSTLYILYSSCWSELSIHIIYLFIQLVHLFYDYLLYFVIYLLFYLHLFVQNRLLWPLNQRNQLRLSLLLPHRQKLRPCLGYCHRPHLPSPSTDRLHCTKYHPRRPSRSCCHHTGPPPDSST